MKSIKCPVCGKRGSVQRKAVPVAGKVYRYLYVAHYNGLSGNTRKIRGITWENQWEAEVRGGVRVPPAEYPRLMTDLRRPRRIGS